ncbi:MAG: agmatinase [Kofleriaceae bacterium]|nr:agmatinase [Kofleriaceae bacterium]
MSQQPAFEYLRHGQTPCFRLPLVDFARSRDTLYRGAGAVVLGVPFDAGTTYQPGARFAPYHVRRVSALIQGWHPGLGVDVFRALRAVDGGNVVFPPFDRAAMRDAVQGEVGAVAAAGAVPVLIGGDHSVALPALRAVAAVHDPVAVIHVDAHLDTSGAEVWGDDHHHGTPIRHAITEGLIAPGQLHQIGLRGPWGGPDDGRLAAGHGGLRLGADDVAARGAAAGAAAIRDALGDRPAYLTFDVDAIDPAYAPGTGTPVPGGLTSREALALIRGLAGIRLVGVDVVEIAPALDHADLTCHLGAHLLFEAMAVIARSR